MIRALIADIATRITAKVTNIGELVTAPYAYNDVVFKELAANDTAYNFYGPKSGQQFVISMITAKADQQVSNTVNATVIIYEAASTVTTTVDKVLLKIDLIRGDLISIPGCNLLVNEGKFINGKTTDDDIHMNIFGYYIPTTD